MPSPWDELQKSRPCVLTSDQDWAPEWAIVALLEFAKSLDLPLHVFRTNPSPALDAAVIAGTITHGWHPNFRPQSSHGATHAEVISSMLKIAGATLYARTHEFAESSSAVAALSDAGVRFLSQLPTMCEPWIAPIRHSTGIYYLPVFWEDDVWLGRYQISSPSVMEREISLPGLKILNVHAAHIGLNTPSMDYYDSRRPQFFDPVVSGPSLRHSDRGTEDLVRELVRTLRLVGAQFTTFPLLCQTVDEATSLWKENI